MEEILASIRRIISDDGEPPAAEPPKAELGGGSPSPRGAEPQPSPAGPRVDEDVLDLADLPEFNRLPDDRGPAAVDLRREEPRPEPRPAAGEAPAPAERADEGASAPAEAPPPPRPSAPAPTGGRADGLISTEATASVGQTFSLLSNMVLARNNRTLEDVVEAMLKPMLKDWLDDNLPPLVERLVRHEIERVARGGR